MGTRLDICLLGGHITARCGAPGARSTERYLPDLSHNEAIARAGRWNASRALLPEAKLGKTFKTPPSRRQEKQRSEQAPRRETKKKMDEPPATPVRPEQRPSRAPSRAQAYTLADVRKHSTKEDGWIVVDGIVYDITNFAKNHPGWTAGGMTSTALGTAHPCVEGRRGTSAVSRDGV